jgi:hypothetical protein
MEMNELAKLAGIEKSDKETMAEFAKKRFDGAQKIADTAYEKGGVALLTYEHFKVKLPLYNKVADGNFDFDSMKKQYVSLCRELHSYMDDIEKVPAKKFQALLGKMEAIGEMLIQSKR